jgi:hypothetical protein
MNGSFLIGNYKINDRVFPQVSAEMGFKDFLGAVRVRWGIGRNSYRVDPGIYAVGNPGQGSDVFVTANYKLSFDGLRKNLSGLDGWVLVLDTKGVNVWCAAGKGTFGTDELVKRIRLVALDKIVDHKRLILPQLGATGVAAHKVKELTGFNVHYGPVRASDIKKFISDGYRADTKMRKVTFNLNERLKVIPVDFMAGKLYLLAAMVFFYIISGFKGNGFSFRDFSGDGGPAILNIALAYISGAVLTPIALPYIPARMFSLKGIYSGAIVFIILHLLNLTGHNIFERISWLLVITSISSYLAMNFTGSSTYTSLPGVKKEMKIFVPVQIGCAALGIILQITGKII